MSTKPRKPAAAGTGSDTDTGSDTGSDTGLYLVGATPLLHDGRRYETGAHIELSQAEADRLGLRSVPADTKE